MGTMNNNSYVLKVMTEMFNILINNNLASEGLCRQYDDICNNYHDILLKELDDNVSTEDGKKVDV